MGYNKIYKPEHIKLVGKTSGTQMYLFLKFNYGFGEPAIGPEGKTITKYQTLQVATGHNVDPNDWVNGDFTPAYMKREKAMYSKIIGDVQDLRKKIFDKYEELLKKNGAKPYPDQIIQAIKGKQDVMVRERLADYIRAYAASRHVPNPRTRQKYMTCATMIDVLEAAREVTPFKAHALTEGLIYLNGFTEDHWTDLQWMLRNASCALPKAFRNHGLEALSFDGTKPFYSANSAQKTEENLMVVLKRAQKDKKAAPMDLNTVERSQRKNGKKEALNVDEITTLVNALPFKNKLMENVRRMAIFQLFLGGFRVGDMKTMLGREMHTIKGQRMNLRVVYLTTAKTAEQCAIPVFEPVRRIMEDETRPYPIAEQVYNRTLKEVCKALGFDRIQHVVERKANGKSVETEAPLWTCVTAHTMRRSYKVFFEYTLLCRRDLCAQAQGHKLDDKSADRAYAVHSPELAAELLIRQAAASVETDPLGFQLIAPEPVIKANAA